MEEILFIVRALADYLPTTLDAIYLFGETFDNQHSVLDRAAKLYFHYGKTASLCIPGGNTHCGYLGESIWRDKLRLEDIPDSKIVSIALPEKSHTHLEAIALIHYAKKNKWRKVAIVAPAFHLPRCFLNTISIVLQEYPELKVYACPGNYLDWDGIATHSQGILRAARSQLVAEEIERIRRYTAKGDLVPITKALEYLNARG